MWLSQTFDLTFNNDVMYRVSQQALTPSIRKIKGHLARVSMPGEPKSSGGSGDVKTLYLLHYCVFFAHATFNMIVKQKKESIRVKHIYINYFNHSIRL